MLKSLFGLIETLLDVYKLVILAYVIVRAMKLPFNRVTSLIWGAVEPACKPIRRFLAEKLPARWQFIDWSPVALWLLVLVAQWLL